MFYYHFIAQILLGKFNILRKSKWKDSESNPFWDKIGEYNKANNCDDWSEDVKKSDTDRMNL